MRVRVVGAGVAGLVCATVLRERGASVEVIDRSARLGAESCSWLAGGMLAPWCEGESAPSIVAELGKASIDWWAARFPQTQQAGSLVVAQSRDHTELQRFAQRTQRHVWVDEEEIARLEPDLAGRYRRGLWFRDEAHLDPRAALDALLQRLANLEVPVRFGVAAEGVLKDVDATVDCRGLLARDVLLDLRGVKGEMAILRAPELAISRPVRMLHPRIPLYIVPRGEGLYMIGATMIESDDRSGVSARSMLELLSGAYALHPGFGEAEIVEVNADVRPAFADNVPKVVERNGTIYINGFYRHGFLLAPAYARMAAEILLES